ALGRCHGQPSRTRPATAQKAPITAQNVLPVIDEPWMRVVPWPIQTTPVRQSRAPTRRRRMVTEITTRARGRRFGGLPEVWLPRCLDHVAVRIEELHADVLGLVPLLDDPDAVGAEPGAERLDGLPARQVDSEVEELGQADRLFGRPEREREPVRVVEHEDAAVVAARRPRGEAETRRLGTAR